MNGDLLKLQRELGRVTVQRNKLIVEAQGLRDRLTASQGVNQRLEQEVQALRERVEYYQQKVHKQGKRRQS